jgi:hypothetical protein
MQSGYTEDTLSVTRLHGGFSSVGSYHPLREAHRLRDPRPRDTRSAARDITSICAYGE